jgi:hypothetical protein
MCALCCIIFISIEITKKTNVGTYKPHWAKPGLDIVIVGLAVVIVGLDIVRPLINGRFAHYGKR